MKNTISLHIDIVPSADPESCVSSDGVKCIFYDLDARVCANIENYLGVTCRNQVFILHDSKCVYNSQLQRDGELVRPERCQGCSDYDYQASITPSCKRQVCPGEERIRYAMENIVMTDGIIDGMERRPSVLDRLKKWRFLRG